MKTFFFIIGSLSLILSSCTTDRDIPENNIIIDPNSELVYYWNFNTLSATVDQVNPDYALVLSDAAITYPGTGAGYMDSFNPGYLINARYNEPDGNGLRVRNPSDTRSLLFHLPTTGYKKILFQLATARSSSGATSQNYSYSLDGINYTTSGLSMDIFTPDVDPTSSIVSLDFTAISGANNNPNFNIKIDFSGDTAAGTSGNNRFDNVTLEGVTN